MVKYLAIIFFSIFFTTGCQKELLLIEKYEPINKDIFINQLLTGMVFSLVSRFCL